MPCSWWNLLQRCNKAAASTAVQNCAWLTASEPALQAWQLEALEAAAEQGLQLIADALASLGIAHELDDFTTGLGFTVDVSLPEHRVALLVRWTAAMIVLQRAR